jgi:hypothetical protein
MLQEQHDVGFINFVDDIFIGSGPMGRRDAQQLAQEIIRRGLDIRMHATIRTREVYPEIFPMLYEAGLRSALIGVESALQERLDWFKKFTTVEMNLRAARYLFELGIYTQTIGFIMFLPDTTAAELRTNLRFILELPTFHPARLDLPLQIVPGFHITDIYREKGLVTGDHILNLDWDFVDKTVEAFYHVQRHLIAQISEMQGLVRALQYALSGDDESLRDIALTDKEITMAAIGWLLEVLSKLEVRDRLTETEFQHYLGKFADLNDRYLGYLVGLRAKALRKGEEKRRQVMATRGKQAAGKGRITAILGGECELPLDTRFQGSSPPFKPRGKPEAEQEVRLPDVPA